MSQYDENDPIAVARLKFFEATWDRDEAAALQLIDAHPEAFLKQVNGREDQPLTNALAAGMAGVVAALLDLGVDVNLHLGPRCGAAIAFAVLMDRLDCAKLLLERGANPNVGWTMLHALNKTPEEEALRYVSLLLRYGADPRRRFHNGRDDAFSYSADKGYRKVLDFLERYEQGVDEG
jgi:ankyrin repeat protein